VPFSRLAQCGHSQLTTLSRLLALNDGDRQEKHQTPRALRDDAKYVSGVLAAWKLQSRPVTSDRGAISQDTSYTIVVTKAISRVESFLRQIFDDFLDDIDLLAHAKYQLLLCP
jgi:hypothetical protein